MTTEKKTPKTTAQRLRRRSEMIVTAWAPVELIKALDEKLSRTKAPGLRGKPSRQQFFLNAIRQFLDAGVKS